MEADEQEIYDYLKNWPKAFVTATEISRRAAGKKRFRENPYWAKPLLTRMVEKGILETDTLGHYRVKTLELQAKKRGRWLSPQIAKILRESGRKFSGDAQLSDLDAPD